MEQSKKECILQAAARAFARFGFKKAAVDQIARDAGVAKGTVYLAADTKEDLFYQTMHREVRAFTAEIGKRIDPRKPADQLLLECALAGVKYLDARPLVRDLVFRNHHLMLPQWADRLEELCELGRANCREILELGIRQGLFRPEIDVVEVAKLVEDVWIATHMFHLRGDGAERDERLSRRLRVATDLLMNGLRRSTAHRARGTDEARS